MGPVPMQTDEGENPCIPFDAVCPFITRKEGNTNFIVRDAYVHDIMHGETLKDKNVIPEDIH